MATPGAHTWTFRARFRRHAFGWKSQPAIRRVNEAVSEIKKVARPSVNTSKAAIYGQRKTGHFADETETEEFYFGSPSVRKVVRTLVRQLFGPHFSTCA